MLDGPVTNRYATPSLSNYLKGTPGESRGRKATGPRPLRLRRGGAAKTKTAELREGQLGGHSFLRPGFRQARRATRRAVRSATLLSIWKDFALPAKQGGWRPEMRRAGLLPSALYLVRPDGHVGMADPLADPERLRDYLSATGMTAWFVTPVERLTEERHA